MIKVVNLTSCYGRFTEVDQIYCSITLMKTIDFSPRLSVATHCFLLHWGEGARQGG